MQLYSDFEEAAVVSEYVIELKESEEYAYKDIAILYRIMRNRVY